MNTNKTYTVRDARGQALEIEERHIINHLREPFKPILVEMGFDAQQIAAYDGDLGYLVNLIVQHIREQECKIQTARKSFRKLKDLREADFQTIMQFLHQQTAAPIDTKVIPINREQKAA